MTPHDLAAAFAIDALDPDERVGFARHLEDCAPCREEVASVREAAASLGASGALSGVGAPGAAPASLRRAVMAALPSTPQDAAPVASVPDAAAPLAATAVPAADPAAPASLTRERRRIPLAWIGTAAAAFLAAALGIGIGGFLSNNADGPALAAHEQAMRIMSAPDAHTLAVPLGRSSLVMSEDYAGAVLMGDTTPMPAHGSEYQIWMKHEDGSMTPGPTFMPDADGTYLVLVQGTMGGVASVMVTAEPAGGSDSPTGPMVAEVTLGA